MRRTLLTALCVVMSLYASAQNLNVQLGPDFTSRDLIEKDETSKYLFRGSGTIIPVDHTIDLSSKRSFTVFDKKGRYFLYSEGYINPTGVKKFASETGLEKGEELEDVLGLVNHQNKMFVFYTVLYQKTKTINLYVNEVNKDLIVMGSPIRLKTYDNAGEISAIQLRISENREHFLFLDFAKTKKWDPIRVGCTVFSGNLEQEWSDMLELKNVRANFDYEHILIDNSSNVYMLGTKYDGRKETPLLCYYDVAKRAFRQYQFDLPDGTSHSTLMKLHKGKDAYVVGLHVKKKVAHNFVYKFDTKAASLKRYEFVALSPSVSKPVSRLTMFISDFAVLANGTVMSVIEGRTDVYKNNIYLHTISGVAVIVGAGNGKQFERFIMKEQICAGYLAGVRLIAAEDRVFAVYNDDGKNLNKAVSDRRIGRYIGRKDLLRDSPVITVQQIDATGKQEKFALSKSPEASGFSILVFSIQRIDNNTFFAAAIKADRWDIRERFLLLEIK